MSDSQGKKDVVSSIVGLFGELAGWKKLLLSVAAMLTALGGAGTIVGKVQHRPDDYKDAARIVESLSAKSSLTDDEKIELRNAEKVQSQHTGFLYDTLSPHTAKAAASFIGAFAVGYAFRKFVKTMAILTGVVLAGVAALTYFDIVDLSSVKLGVERSAGWATKVATHAKDYVMTWFPSTVTSFVGFAAGFMKR
jgi:uncharacterized membrane protein (Fun14 family)